MNVTIEMAILCRVRLLLVMGWMVFTCLTSQAQKRVEPGMDVSDIVLHGVSNYSDSVLKISDFKGKYILLDFWTTGCGTCRSKMPLMDSLQNEFSDNIQIVLVNSKESKTDATRRLLKYEQRVGVGSIIPEGLPSSIGDFLLNAVFPHITVPHHVWIGPEGSILYITNGHNTTRENVWKMINGEDLNANLKNDLEWSFFRHKTLSSWINENQISDRVYLTDFVIIPYHEEMEGPVVLEGLSDPSGKRLRYTYPNASLMSLYYYAVRDKSYGNRFGSHTNNFISPRRWLITTKHPAWVNRPDDYKYLDIWKRSAYFSCELEIPVEDSLNFQNHLKNRLDEYVNVHQRVQVTKKMINTDCVVFSKWQINDQVKSATVEGRTVRFSSYLSNLYRLNRGLFDALEMPIILDHNDLEVLLPKARKYDSINELKKDLNQFGYDVQIVSKSIDMMLVEDIANVE